MSVKHEIWNRKSIIWDFAVTDLKMRYRNSVLGFVWTILEPLFILLVLYIVFTNIFSNTIEYFPLYLLLGLIMWNMVVRGTQLALNSTLSRSSILSQIYIPVAIPPTSASITSLIMLAFEMVVFGFFLVAYQFLPPATIVLLPLIVVLEFLVVIGLALPLSVLNVRLRDTQFIWNVILTAGFFLNPIFYTMDVLPKTAQSILIYLPTVQILNFARDVALYGKVPTLENVAIALVTSLIIFGIGYAIFKKLSSGIIEEL